MQLDKENYLENYLKVSVTLTVMCEVTSKNFEEKYPEIIDNLKSASFISIDCEFTGLYDDDYKCSLFDGPKVRFNKLQKSLKNALIVQLGLSTFKYERENNKFTCSSYTFYLIPSTILANTKFMCQMGSIEFLTKHSFDFNKLFYDGINFLNKSDESKVLRMIEDGSLVDVENLNEIQKYCSQIAEWSGGVEQGGEMLLELNKKSTFIYLLHQEIRKRFPNMWTYSDEPGIIRIRKLEESERRKLLLDREDIDLKKKLLDSILGFSRIVKEIQNLKKPIIGHNFLLDLILIHKQFYNPMPITYKEFKKVITEIFPNIYDTKSMSFELRQKLSREDTWHSNCLSDLYYYLKNGKGATLVIFTPSINHTNAEFLEKDNFHEAGFDSYCTGFCFIKMAHILSLWNAEKKSFHITSMPTSTSWLLGAVDSMKNKVNITRGQVNHIALSGQDPKSVRPGLLFIRSKTNEALDIPKILESIAKYDSVDIQLLNKYSGLIATSNRKQVREILEYFKNHKKIEVNKYSFLKHSVTGRMVVASTAIIASLLYIAIRFSKGWAKVH